MGKQAMSATERQRRWRAKKRVSKAAPKPAVSTGASERLQARLRELETERAALRTEIEKLHAEVTRFMRAWAGSWTLNKARVRELETQLEAERREREASPDPTSLPKSYRKRYEAARRRQDREYEDRIKQEAHRLLNELFLPSSTRGDAHNALDNVLARAEPFVPQVTGYRDLRPVRGARAKRARATRH
jgi:hypothetical protein